jgi:hypothetical protein
VIRPFDRTVYQALAAYCFGEAVCWPSQDTLAADLGCSRYSVNRSIGRLKGAGWLTVTKRPGRTGWLHNIYELLEGWRPVGRRVAERIVERARRLRSRGLHTNPEGVGRRDGLRGAQQGPERHRRSTGVRGDARPRPVAAAGDDRGRAER